MTDQQFKFIRYMGQLVGRIVLAIATLVVAFTQHPALAGTPYEAQLSGRIYAVLTTLIIGEFGGRTRASTATNLKRRACKPDDYAKLAVAARDNATLIAFHNECRLVEIRFDYTDPRRVRIEEIAYLPEGVCELIKSAFETVLAEQIQGVPNDSNAHLVVTHKMVTYETIAQDRDLLRSAEIIASCRPDGALHVSARRMKR